MFAELLESRRLLNGAPSISNNAGVLTVNGSKENDVIVVSENNGAVHVELTTLPKKGGGVFITQDFLGITAIKINGLKGDDAIFYTGDSIGADIHGDGSSKNNGGTGGSGGSGGSGGTGKDFIVVADEGTGATTLDGDGGDDDLTVLVGNMTGDTTVVFGGKGDDHINLNTGVGVYANIANAQTEVFAESGKDIITAYEGQNTIDGGKDKDILIELGGVNTTTNVEQTVP